MMTWTVYCRTNVLNGKKYVGVTKRTIEERWDMSVKDAHKTMSELQLRRDRLTQRNPKTGGEKTQLQIKRINEKIERLKGSMSYDIITMGLDAWEHTTLETFDNMIEALLAERSWIAKLNLQNPDIGYNRSPGGELPKWINVVDVVDDVERYLQKQ